MGRPNLPHTVYAIRCKENGRVYVGATVYPQKRIYQHMAQLKRRGKVHYEVGKAVPSLWQEDYDKYGENGFSFYILEEDITLQDVPYREKYWIAQYKAFDPRYGYNQQRYQKKAEQLFEAGKPPLPEEDKR